MDRCSRRLGVARRAGVRSARVVGVASSCCRRVLASVSPCFPPRKVRAELRSTAIPTQCQRFGDPRTGAGRDRGTSGRGSCRRTPSRTDRHRCAGGRCRESSPPTSGHAYPSHTTSAATSMMTVSVNKSRSHEFMPQNGRTEGRTRDNSLPTDTVETRSQPPPSVFAFGVVDTPRARGRYSASQWLSRQG